MAAGSSCRWTWSPKRLRGVWQWWTGNDRVSGGRKGDLVKILWHVGVGMSLYPKRLEAGKFIWPVGRSGEAVQISAAPLGYLLEGIARRNPRCTQRPAKAG